jgi:streptogramin lyase
MVKAVAVSALLVLVGACSGSSGTTTPPSRAVDAARIDLPTGVVDVAAEGDSVWVAGFGIVARLSSETSEVVATIETPGASGYSSVSAASESVWVTEGGKVYRIDPETNQVVAVVDVGGSITGVAVGGGFVWITRSGEPTGELLRIDPTSNLLVGDPIPVGPGPGEVTFGLGAVWVANTSPPSVVRVDPVSGEVDTVSPRHRAVAIADGSVWMAGLDEVVRVDPDSGAALARFPIPRAGWLAVGDGAVWVLAWPEERSAGISSPIEGTAALWQIDPVTNTVVGTPVAVGGLQLIAIAVTDDAVWIGDYTAMTVARFDLVPCADPACG